MVRVVVLDRETGETFTEDIGDDNPVAIYVPGDHAHGFEALTDCLFCYFVTEEYDPADPDEHGVRGTIRASPTCGAPDRRSCRSGTSARARDHRRRRPTRPRARRGVPGRARADARRLGRRATRRRRVPSSADLVLHAAAWTDVDGAEDDPQGAAAVNVGGVAARGGARRAARRLLDRLRLRRRETRAVRRVGRARPARRLRAHEAARRGGGGRAAPGSCAPRGSSGGRRRTSCARCCGSARERDEVAVVDDQRGSPTYVGHLAEATKEVLRLPYGVYHVAAAGDCTWAEFAEAIFEEAGLDSRVRRITSAELGLRATRPAYSVLRSESGAPALPHWREGLRECLRRPVSTL